MSAIDFLKTQGAAFVSGMAATVVLYVLWVIVSHEVRMWLIRRRHKINSLVGRSILHRP